MEVCTWVKSQPKLIDQLLLSTILNMYTAERRNVLWTKIPDNQKSGKHKWTLGKFLRLNWRCTNQYILTQGSVGPLSNHQPIPFCETSKSLFIMLSPIHISTRVSTLIFWNGLWISQSQTDMWWTSGMKIQIKDDGCSKLNLRSTFCFKQT